MAYWYWDSYPFSRRVRHRDLMKHLIPCTSRVFIGMWGPLSRWRLHLRLSLGSPHGNQTVFILWEERRAWIYATAGKSGLLLSQGLSVSIPLETENTGSLSHRYCWGKTPLEVLVECWLTSSVKDRESALIFRRYGGAWSIIQVAVVKLIFI